MTLKTSAWAPDTCSCVVNYSWDDTVIQTIPMGDPAFGANANVLAGPEHSGVSVSGLYAAVVAENHKKNNVPQWSGVAIVSGISDFDYYRQLWNFSGVGVFSGERIMSLSVSSFLSPANQARLQSGLNAFFGSGRIIVD